jgi:D-glycero-beta-D-manno-heptose 1-phosphate adenylyltransferase
MTTSTELPSQKSEDVQDHWAHKWREKLIERKAVGQWAQGQREQGLTIATLNGSFDLLHAGHLHMIYEASKQADRLLLALNTDRSIQGYKSPHRPLITLEYRLQMVAAIGFVSKVTWFDELTPCDLLEEVRPDVHVNGAEYGEECVESKVVRRCGGRIHIVSLVPGLSTSKLLERVKQCD